MWSRVDSPTQEALLQCTALGATREDIDHHLAPIGSRGEMVSSSSNFARVGGFPAYGAETR